MTRQLISTNQATTAPFVSREASAAERLRSSRITGHVVLGRFQLCGVEVWRGGLGGAYLLPAISSVRTSLAPPCVRFHPPLMQPHLRISRVQLSANIHPI